MLTEQEKAIQTEIEAKKKQALALIAECEDLANKHKLEFSWDLAYGMGGWYNGSDQEWSASSHNC